MSTPSGWYSDPQREGHTRYWDGSTWGITDDEYQLHHGMGVASQSAEPTSVEIEPQRSDGEAATTSPDSGGGLRRLQCDLCNGTEFTKEEEFFVCDFCRTKYSPETARKMMIQGTVEVAGTVQVDRASEVANLVLLSKTALAHGSAEESFDYANRALTIDSTNWEAWRCKADAATGMATFEDLRVSEFLGAIDAALSFAPQDSRDDLQRQWAEELRERGVELYVASVGQLNRFSWTGELEWSRHVNRSLETLRVLDKSYNWCPGPEALRDSIRVAVDLLGGFLYKEDGHWDAVNLAPTVEEAMRTLLEDRSREMLRFDPTYIMPRPKKARWLSFRRTNPSYD